MLLFKILLKSSIHFVSLLIFKIKESHFLESFFKFLMLFSLSILFLPVIVIVALAFKSPLAIDKPIPLFPPMISDLCPDKLNIL